MTENSDLDLDLAMLMADARTFRRLAVGRDPLLALALAPYVATFACESLGCLRRRRMATGSFGDHAAAIEQARHSLKFLDDSKRGVTGVVETFERIGVASHQMFIGAHAGILGPLKRRLQDDLSIFVSEGRMIGTSHSTMVQSFSDQRRPPVTLAQLEARRPELHARSIAVGQYIAMVLNALMPGYRPTPSSDPTLSAKGVDAKSRVFYRSLLRSNDSVATGWAMLIVALLSSTNFVLHALPIMTGCEAIHRWFVFKWRLITIFHVHSSLQHIAASEPAKAILHPDIVNTIVAQRRKLRSIQNLKRLRDALVHYDLRKQSKDNRATPAEQLDTHMRTEGSSIENALGDVSVALARFLPS